MDLHNLSTLTLCAAVAVAMGAVAWPTKKPKRADRSQDLLTRIHNLQQINHQPGNQKQAS